MIKIILNDGREFENDPRYGYNLSDVNEIWECLNLAGMYSLFTKSEKNLNFIKEESLDEALSANPEKDGEVINIFKKDVKDIIEINAFLR